MSLKGWVPLTSPFLLFGKPTQNKVSLSLEKIREKARVIIKKDLRNEIELSLLGKIKTMISKWDCHSLATISKNLVKMYL